MTMGIWGVLGVGLILLIAVAFGYNALVKARQLALSGWSDIDVQLKRRADLIPNLIDTVKGYAAHERKLFTEITERRVAAMSAGDNAKSRAAAEGALARSTGRLFAVAEDYPDLKASDNFLDLQKELAETEDTIEMARRFYNGAVRQLNTKVESFPLNLLAGMFGFSKKDYFEISDNDRIVPSV